MSLWESVVLLSVVTDTLSMVGNTALYDGLTIVYCTELHCSIGHSVQILEVQNESLREDLTQLTEERRRLEELLDTHRYSTLCRYSTFLLFITTRH